MLRLIRCGSRRAPEAFPPAPGGSPSPTPISAAGLPAAPARAARLLRRAAGLLVLAGLVGGLVVPSQAQAQTSTDLLTATLTPGTGENDQRGYCAIADDTSVGPANGGCDYGMLSTTGFTLDTVSYTVLSIRHAYGSANNLHLTTSPALPSGKLSELTLHIGTRTFDLDDAVVGTLGAADRIIPGNLKWTSITPFLFPTSDTAAIKLVHTAAATGTNNPPEFSDATATRSVAENTAAGQDIGSPVSATDTDTGDTLAYTLEGTDASSFGIVSTSGQLQTKVGVGYDHETDTSYSVTVKVSDGTAEATIAVTINVSNEDEAGTVALTNDNPPRVGAALVASLTDPDGTPGNVTWQWSSAATAAGTFANITGATSTSYTPVMGDVGNFLKATASYDDPQGTGKTAEAVSASATTQATPVPALPLPMLLLGVGGMAALGRFALVRARRPPPRRARRPPASRW